MVSTLDKISIEQLICLFEGKFDVLLSDGEHADEQKLADTGEKMLLQYKSITEGTKTKMRYIEGENKAHLEIKLTMLNIADNLMMMGDYTDVREIVQLLGEKPHENDEMLKNQCQRMKAKYGLQHKLLLQKMKDRKEKQDDVPAVPIREQFMAEIADISIFLKISIDTDKTNAMTYAYIVKKANEQARALHRESEKMKKKSRH